MQDAGEVWKKVPGMTDVLASSLGRILAPKGTGNSTKVTMCIRVQSNAHSGYRSVRIGNRNHYVHRLVCLAFHGESPKGKAHVGHFDGDPMNNRPENLRWLSASENAADKVRHGRQQIMCGERSGMAKLKESDVAKIFAASASGMSQRAIGAKFGVSHTTVYSIVKGEGWGHVTRKS